VLLFCRRSNLVPTTPLHLFIPLKALSTCRKDPTWSSGEYFPRTHILITLSISILDIYVKIMIFFQPCKITKVQGDSKKEIRRKGKTIFFANIKLMHPEIILLVFTLHSQISISQTICNSTVTLWGRRAAPLIPYFNCTPRNIVKNKQTPALVFKIETIITINCSNCYY